MTTRRGADSSRIPAIDLDRGHPTPLYHQIASAIRWRIGTGDLEPGETLPSLRHAAKAWRVSYHTVRRAYEELGRAGYVDPARGSGTRVLRRLAADGSAVDGDRTLPSEAYEFARSVIREGRRRFGLSPSDLTELLLRAPDVAAGEGDAGAESAVTVVECNDQQAGDLAAQLESRFGVRARPWNLASDGEPPSGPIVATWFHHAEIVARWPHRSEDLRFAALCLDPGIRDEILEAPVDWNGLVLVERDVGTGRQHAADLLAVLRRSVEVTVATSLPGLDELEASDDLFVIAPRLWDALPDAVQRHPRVLLLRHVFEPADLEAIGSASGTLVTERGLQDRI